MKKPTLLALSALCLAAIVSCGRKEQSGTKVTTLPAFEQQFATPDREWRTIDRKSVV
jgi:hypothetical protein